MAQMAQTPNHQGVIAIVPPFEYCEIEDILENAEALEKELQEIEITYATGKQKIIAIDENISRIEMRLNKLKEEQSKLEEQKNQATENKKNIENEINKISEENEKLSKIITEFAELNKDNQKYIDDLNFDITNLKMPSLSSFFLGGGQEQKADGRYTGDSYYKGGMTWLAERGREVVKYPSGQIALVNNKSMGYLPKGTKIFNNSATEKMLNPKNTITERVDNLKERFQRLVNSNNSTTVSYGGNNITININTTSDQDPRAIAREAVKLFKEELDKNRRKEF